MLDVAQPMEVGDGPYPNLPQIHTGAWEKLGAMKVPIPTRLPCESSI